MIDIDLKNNLVEIIFDKRIFKFIKEEYEEILERLRKLKLLTPEPEIVSEGAFQEVIGQINRIYQEDENIIFQVKNEGVKFKIFTYGLEKTKIQKLENKDQDNTLELFSFAKQKF